MYKVTIERTDDVVRRVGKEWKVVEQTKPDLKRVHLLDGVPSDSNITIHISNEDVYGYTPEIDKVERVTTKVYEQSVAELDIVRVIGAVNGQPVEARTGKLDATTDKQPEKDSVRDVFYEASLVRRMQEVLKRTAAYDASAIVDAQNLLIEMGIKWDAPRNTR